MSCKLWLARLANSSKKLRSTRRYFGYCDKTVINLNLRVRLVLSTLDEALEGEPDRKCFRLIGGVLVERTVKDVVPALKTNRDGVSRRCSSRFHPI